MTDRSTEFAELMERVLEGSQDAAWKLLEDYGPHVHRYVRRGLNQQLRSKFDSLDFAQVVWASIFREPERLRKLKTPDDLMAYLNAMARNKMVGEVRRRLVSQKYDISHDQEFNELDEVQVEARVRHDPTPSAIAVAHERWRQLVDNQPPLVRRIVEMRFMGATFSEIAAQLQIHERTARKTIDDLVADCTNQEV